PLCLILIPSSTQASNKLTVATVERPPFVMKRGTGYIGYSIELWDKIAEELDIDYEVNLYGTFPEMLNSVKDKQADLAIANITVTSEREQYLDFSHPIFFSGLQIMLSKSQPSGFTETAKAILNSGILQFIGVSLLILLVVAHLIWFFEWGDDRDFNDSYKKGIWDSLWWAMVTVTTVGYGDQVPRTIRGRILALLWMLFSLFLMSVIIAQVSSSIINASFDGSISGPEDLQEHHVATIAGSTSEKYLHKMDITATGFDSIENMLDALRQNRADAVVFDAPVLAYQQAHDSSNDFKLVGRIFKPEQLSIALQADSPHRDPINQALLKLSEEGVVQKIYADWFSKDVIYK
ncbi:MAG: transporter substrate-binding domain-containing protein, partial [Thiolinea sp.]